MTFTWGGRGAVRLLLPFVALAFALPALRSHTPPARKHVVEIQGMAFHPPRLQAAPGDTIVFINRDMFSHTATSDTTGGNRWDTGEIAPDDTGRVVLPPRPVPQYFCKLHPSMKGSLYQ